MKEEEKSRQQRWIEKMVAQKRCVVCGSRNLETKYYCAKHAEMVRARAREKYGHQQWQPGSRGRKPIKATTTPPTASA